MNANSSKSIDGIFCYIFGLIGLVVLLLLFTQINFYLQSPYVAVYAAVLWLLVIVNTTLFVLGAKLRTKEKQN